MLQNKPPKTLRYKTTILLCPQILGFRHRGMGWMPQCLGPRLKVTQTDVGCGISGGVFAHMSGARRRLSAATPTRGPSCGLPTEASLGFLTARWLCSTSKRPERKAEAQGIFMVLPQKSHSVTSVMLCWLKKSQRSAQFQEEGIQTPPPHAVGEVKVL